MSLRPQPVIHDDYAEISLGGNDWAKVDLSDLELVADIAWHVHNAGYAVSPKHVLMHRFIMQPTGRVQVDHANGDRLDNRRSNLRFATYSDNAHNMRKRTGRLYKNVYPVKRRWYSTICIDRKQFNLGTYDSPEEAAWMYDQWATQLHGDFAKLNFDYVLTIKTNSS